MKRSLYWMGILICTLVCLEMLAYMHFPYAATVGLFVWTVGGVCFLVISLYFISKTIVNDIAQSAWSPVLALFCVVVMVLFTADLDYINHESAQQLGETMQQLRAGNFNYTGIAFLAYPIRQYLIALVPTFFLGEGAIELRLGYLFPVVIGATLFYVALRRPTVSAAVAPELSAAIILSLFSSQFLLKFILHAEQSIFPIAFTMCTIGWLALVSERVTPWRILGLIWIGSLVGVSYTPGLATAALLICMGRAGVMEQKAGRGISDSRSLLGHTMPYSYVVSVQGRYYLCVRRTGG